MRTATIYHRTMRIGALVLLVGPLSTDPGPCLCIPACAVNPQFDRKAAEAAAGERREVIVDKEEDKAFVAAVIDQVGWGVLSSLPG
jgi:hypothetical protein